MAIKIEIIDELNINIYEPAKILGFIDAGSETKSSYTYEGHVWRNTSTGRRLHDEHNSLREWDLDEFIDRWKFLKSQGKERNTFEYFPPAF